MKTCFALVRSRVDAIDGICNSYGEYFKKLYITMKLAGFVRCPRRRNDVTTSEQQQALDTHFGFHILHKGKKDETTTT